MRRLISAGARAGAALLCGLAVLAVLRWAPVSARPPLDVRALALAGPAILLAVLAGLTAVPRRSPPVRRFVAALLVVLAGLAVVVAVRPAAGLVVEVSDPRGLLGRAGPGPVDVAGPDLRDLPSAHKWTLRWDGPLRAPGAGAYRLWATGRGTVEVAIDGRVVLRGGDGEVIHAGADVPLTAGPHALEVTLRRTGPGPRLRLGWTRPGGGPEVLLPRDLGAPIGRAWWLLTDALALVAGAFVAVIVWRAPWDAPRIPPPPGAVTRAEIAWSLAGHAVLVAVMSWPLVLDLAHQGVTDRPDGRLNAWILAWDVHALVHAPGRLFQAPIFHPLPDTLAFSENLLVPALLAAPGIAASGPVLGYNLALLVSLVVSGLGVQLLVRRASGDRLAAFVAGAFFAVGAHRWVRLAHLHAQVTLFLPLVLLALDRFWERRTLRRAAAVGVLIALQGLSSVYLGAITALVVAVAVALAILAGLRGLSLVRLLAGLALGALLLAPVAHPYLRMRAFEGVEFTLADVGTYATTLESYAASGTRLYGAITQKHLDPERVQDTLFPGLALVVLGLAGVASAPRRYRLVAVAASLVAVGFSLGPETGAYRFLHEHLLLVRGVRALSRFSLVPVLALSVLAGFALARRWRLALVALVLFAIESSNVPIRYAPAPEPSAAARWLSGRPGAVAVLPLGEDDTSAMLDAGAHWRPLANGDSGFMPRPYTHEMELLALPLDADALRYLRAVGVTDVVAREGAGIPEAARFGEDRVFAVPDGPRAAVVAEGEPVATRWTSEGAVIDLPTPRPMAGITFDPADAPWIDAPRVSVSDDGVMWRDVPATASLADATLSLMADPRRGRGEVRFGPVDGRARPARRAPARASGDARCARALIEPAIRAEAAGDGARPWRGSARRASRRPRRAAAGREASRTTRPAPRPRAGGRPHREPRPTGRREGWCGGRCPRCWSRRRRRRRRRRATGGRRPRARGSSSPLARRAPRR